MLDQAGQDQLEVETAADVARDASERVGPMEAVGDIVRSAGGSDDPSNLVSLYAAHHLQCVHNGWIRVRGKAPDGLYWELGVRPGRAPLVVVEPAAASAETR